MFNYNYNYPTTSEFINAVNLIEQSVEGEKNDALFYEWLINNIPRQGLTNQEIQNIRNTIMSIRDDEMSHNKTFKKMYKTFTGKDAVPEEKEFVPPANFVEGIVEALNGELNAVKRYRVIMAGMPNLAFRDKVFNILSDEIRHSSLYNYIYTTVLNEEQ